jgi:lipoprotein-anchoring transpeptidase ErfK/SrfK
VGAAAYPVVRGFTDPAFAALSSARRALDEARRAGAATWASAELADAETQFRRASADHRRQEVRLLPLRDYRKVRTEIASAESKSREATDRARARGRDTAAEAAAAVTEAERAIGEATRFVDIVPLSQPERTTFQKARLALEEAKIHRRRGALSRSVELAHRSASLAQGVTEQAAATAGRYRDPALVKRWRRWIDETVAWSRQSGEPAIVVVKDAHRLVLYDGGRRVLTLDVELGTNWARQKRASLDAATPEGRYKVTAKKDRGQSAYYKALLIDYPNAEDRAHFEQARRRGEIPKGATPGGLIEIHGEGGKGRDWTRGCVAVTNPEIDRIFRLVKVGTPVTIVGGNGGDGTLAELVDRHRDKSKAAR